MLTNKEILCCIRFKRALGQEGYKQLASYQICWLEIVEMYKTPISIRAWFKKI